MVRSFEPTWDNGECTFVLNESMTTRQRISKAFNIPPLLNENRVLTKTELERIEYTELQADKIYWVQAESGRKYPVAFRISTAFLQKHGFLQRLASIRAKLLTEEFKNKMARLSNLSDAGTRYLLGLTEMPRWSWSTIQVGSVSKAENETGLQSILAELTAVVSEATELAVPDVCARGQEDLWYQRASLTTGSRKNHIYTNVQLNYCREGQKLSDGLKKFGGVHRDRQNDPSTLTALVSLSHLSEDYFGGRFNVTSLNITVPLLPYEITLFPGRYFHCSTGVGPYSVPRESPLRHPSPQAGLIPPLPEGISYSRLAIPLWSSHRQLRPEVRWLNEHIYTNLGQAIFEDYAHHLEWMMHFYIVNEPEIILRLDGKISSEPGSGPQQLIDVARAARKAIEKPEIARLTATIPRTGGAEHYISLFTCKDPATSKIVMPRIEEAIKTLEALPKDNSSYEMFYNDMQNLVKRIGANSPAIPMWAKSSPTQRKARVRALNARSARPKARLREVGSDYEQSEIEDSDDEDDVRADDGMAVDFGFTELTKLMDQLTASNIKPAGNEELTGVVMGLSSVLKDFIAYAIKQDGTRSNTTSSGIKQPNPSNRGTLDSSEFSKRKANSEPDTRKLKRVAQDHVKRKEGQKRSRTDTTTRKRDMHGRWASETESDTEVEYEIENIVARRPTKSGRAIYRVRWRGWGPEWDEWKTARELEHATDLVAEYEHRCDKWNEHVHGKEARAHDDTMLQSGEAEDLEPEHVKTPDRIVDDFIADENKSGIVVQEEVMIKPEITNFAELNVYRHSPFPERLILAEA